MSTIDQRIVQMQFDNAQFEKGVHTSINSLNALKEALNFDGVTSSVGKISGTMFKPLDTAISGLTSGFSALETIGTGALLSIGNQVAKTGMQFVSSLIKPLKDFQTGFNQIVSGGWTRASNIEQAKFMLSNLGVEWEEIKEDISYAVDGTRFGMDSAAKAAAQLATSNVQLGDEMRAALRGISGVATMTNREYEDIARIFTSVAGRNRLYGEDLTRLSERGINAAEKLGKALNVTQEEVREMTSKGEIDFKTFAKAMDDAFGESSTKANETFTGALANMKAALSRIGERFATPYQQAFKGIYNSQRNLINQLSKGLEPIYTTYEKFMSGFETKITGILDSLTKSLEDGSSPFHTFVNWVNTLFEALTKLNNVSETVSSVLDPFNVRKITSQKSVLQTYAEQISNLHNNIKELAEAAAEQRNDGSFFSGEAILGRLQSTKSLKEQTSGLNSFSDGIKEFFKNTKDSLSGNIDFDEIKNFPLALNGIQAAIDELNKESLLDKAGKSIKSSFDKVKEGVESFKISTEEAKKRVAGLYDVVEVANQVIRGDFDNGVEIRFPLLEEAGYYPELIQNVVNELLDCGYRYDLFSDKLEASNEKMAASNEKMAESLEDPLKKFSDLDLTLAGLWSAFDTVKRAIKAVINGATEPLTNIGSGLVNTFLKLTGSLGTAAIKFEDFLDKANAFTKLKITVNDLLTTLYNFGSAITGSISKKLDQLGTLFGRVGEKISIFRSMFKFTEGYKLIVEDINNLKTALTGLKDTVVNWFKNKFSIFDNFDLSLPDWRPTLEDLQKAVETVSNFIVDIHTGFKDIRSSLHDKFIKPLVDGFNTDFLKEFKLADIPGAILSVFTGKKVFAAELDDSVEGLSELDEKSKGVVLTFKQMRESVKDFLLDKLDLATGGLITKFKTLKQTVKDIAIETLRNKIIGLGKAGIPILGEFAAFMLSGEKEANKLTDATDGIDLEVKKESIESIDELNEKSENLLITLLKARGGVLGFVAEMAEGFSKSGKAAKGLDLFTSAINYFKNIGTKMANAKLPFEINFEELFNSVVEAGKTFVTETIPNLIKAIGKGISNFIDWLLDTNEERNPFDWGDKGVFGGFKDLIVTTIIEKLPDGVGEVLTGIKEKFIEPLTKGFNKDFLKDFKITDVPGAILSLFTGVKVSAAELTDTVSEESIETISLFETIGKGLSIVTSSLTPEFTSFGAAIDWIKDKIDKFLHWLNPEFDYSYESVKKTITDVASFISGTRVLFGLGTFSSNVNGFLKNAKAWPKSFNSIIKAIADIPDSISHMLGGNKEEGVLGSIRTFLVGSKDQRRGGIAGMGTMLYEFGNAAKRVSKGIKRSDTASALLKLAVAIGAVAASFYFLSKLSWDELKKGSLAIIVIAGALAVLLLVLSKFTNKGDASVQNSSGLKNLTGLTTGLKDFLKKQIAPLKKELEKIKKSAFFVTMGTVMTRLVAAFAKLAKLNSAQILAAIISLAAIMAEFVLMVHFLNNEFKDSNVTLRQSIAMVAAALAIKLVASAFKSLGNMNLGSIVKGIVGLMAVAGALSVVLDASKGKGGWGKLLALIPIIAEVVAGMFLLSLLPTKELKTVSTSLLKVFGSIALVIFSISSMKNVSGGKMFATLAMMEILIAEIAGIFILFDGMGIKNIDGIADGFMKMMAGMAVLAAGLSLMMGTSSTGMGVFTKGLGAAGVVGIVTLVITTVASIVAAIDEHFFGRSFLATLQKAQQYMEQIGGILGSLLGGIIGGIITPVKNLLFGDTSFSETLDNFSAFMEKVAATFSSEYTYNTDAITSMSGLLKDIGKAELYNGIGEFIEGLDIIGSFLGAAGADGHTDLYEKLDSYAKFTEKLSEAFGDDSKFNLDAIDTISKIITAMGEAEMNNASSNFVQNLNDFLFGYGDNNDTYGEKLTAFATAMVDYSNAIDGMNEDAVTRTQTAVGIIQEFGNNLPDSGGVLQQWTGEGNFASFVQGLPTFGAKIKKYSENIAGMNTDVVASTEAAVNSVIKFAAEMPRQDGMLQTLIGTQKFEGFTEGLPKFGEDMKAYGDAINGMNTKAVEDTTAAVDSIVKLATELPNSGGVLGVLVGDNDLDDFGQMMLNFGIDMKWFDEYLNGLTYSGVDPAIKVITDFATAFDTFKESANVYDSVVSDSIYQAAEAVDLLYDSLSEAVESDQGETLKQMGVNIVTYILAGFEDEVKKENVIDKFVALLSDLISDTDVSKTMETKGESVIGNVIDAMDQILKNDDSRFNTGFSLILNNMFNDGESTIETRGTTMRAKMNSAFLRLIQSINSHRTGITLAIKSVFSEIERIVDAAANTIKLSGTNIMRGLAQGITTGTKLATDAAKTSAQAVITTTNNTLKEKSPSREAMKSGRFYMEGLRLGILDNETFLLSTVDKVAGSAVSRMDTNIEAMRGVSEETMAQVYASIIAAWNYIQTAVDESMTYSPVITPVLDLSNVNSGLNSVNSMLTDTSMFSRLSVPGFDIGNNYNVQSGDLYNQEAIVSQIRGLRTDINTLGDAMSRMQVIMSTGQMVGAVTPGIDRELGSIQKYNARWA